MSLIGSNNTLESKIDFIFDEIELPKTTWGGQYLRTAVILAMEGQVSVESMGKLYSAIAEEYQVLVRTASSAMSRAIEDAWNHGNAEAIRKYFGHTVTLFRGMPTNGAFISMLLDVLRHSENETEEIVSHVLHTLGIPANIKGHDYLRTAILLSLNGEFSTDDIKELCLEVAKRNSVGGADIARSMRRAINIAWTTSGDVTTLNRYFGYTSQGTRPRPQNEEFIRVVVARIKSEYNL